MYLQIYECGVSYYFMPQILYFPGSPSNAFAETKLLVAPPLPRTSPEAGEVKEGGITGLGDSGPLHVVLEMHNGKSKYTHVCMIMMSIASCP